MLSMEVTQTATGWRADHRKGQHDDHLFAVMLAAHHLRARLPAPATIEAEEAQRPEGSTFSATRESGTNLIDILRARRARLGLADAENITQNARVTATRNSYNGEFDPEVFEGELLQYLDDIRRSRDAGLGLAYDVRSR